MKGGAGDLCTSMYGLQVAMVEQSEVSDVAKNNQLGSEHRARKEAEVVDAVKNG